MTNVIKYCSRCKQLLTEDEQKNIATIRNLYGWNLCDSCVSQEIEKKQIEEAEKKTKIEIERLKKVREERQKRVADIKYQLGRQIPPLFQDARMKNISKSIRSELATRKETQGLLLWGNPGTGKSYAMAAYLRSIIVKGYSCVRVSYERLCLDIRASYNGNGNERRIIEELTSCNFLLIEDLGTTVSAGKAESDFSLRTFLMIIDTRLEQCIPTLITSNKSVEQIGETFDARIESRLKTFKVIHLGGKDRRETVGCVILPGEKQK
ncbi:MAG: ATP-binding protein [Sedimentisphaerales bacterium]|nr:ATP-binding protein [Sedimentisphaerales bacterium]